MGALRSPRERRRRREVLVGVLILVVGLPVALGAHIIFLGYLLRGG